MLSLFKRWCRAGCMAAAMVAASPAWPLPMPESYVGVACGTTADNGLTQVGPAKGIFSLACDRSGTSTWPPPGGEWQAAAQALTGYAVSGAAGGVGIADAAASVNVNGTLRDPAATAAGASIRYQMAFESAGLPSFNPPRIAIEFSAQGHAQVSGADSLFFNIGSTLGVDQFPYADFERNSRAGDSSGSFNARATLWVAPQSVSQVFVYAACHFTRYLPGTAECQAVADPTIRFDQGAFDAFYGVQSFDLASAYRITFSQPVPEVAMRWQWLAGLALLIGLPALRSTGVGARQKAQCSVRRCSRHKTASLPP